MASTNYHFHDGRPDAQGVVSPKINAFNLLNFERRIEEEYGITKYSSSNIEALSGNVELFDYIVGTVTSEFPKIIETREEELQDGTRYRYEIITIFNPDDVLHDIIGIIRVDKNTYRKNLDSPSYVLTRSQRHTYELLDKNDKVLYDNSSDGVLKKVDIDVVSLI